jgi:hypothetical protein
MRLPANMGRNSDNYPSQYEHVRFKQSCFVRNPWHQEFEVGGRLQRLSEVPPLTQLRKPEIRGD